jgi:hypothetical protein
MVEPLVASPVRTVAAGGLGALFVPWRRRSRAVPRRAEASDRRRCRAGCPRRRRLGCRAPAARGRGRSAGGSRTSVPRARRPSHGWRRARRTPCRERRRPGRSALRREAEVGLLERVALLEVRGVGEADGELARLVVSVVALGLEGDEPLFEGTQRRVERARVGDVQRGAEFGLGRAAVTGLEQGEGGDDAERGDDQVAVGRLGAEGPEHVIAERRHGVTGDGRVGFLWRRHLLRLGEDHGVTAPSLAPARRRQERDGECGPQPASMHGADHGRPCAFVPGINRRPWFWSPLPPRRGGSGDQNGVSASGRDGRRGRA